MAEDAHDRLFALERQNRRLRGAVVILVLLAGMLLWLGAAEQRLIPQRIQAQEFVLSDADGTTRAALTLRNGQPKLELYGENGKVTWSAPPHHRVLPVR